MIVQKFCFILASGWLKRGDCFIGSFLVFKKPIRISLSQNIFSVVFILALISELKVVTHSPLFYWEEWVCFEPFPRKEICGRPLVLKQGKAPCLILLQLGIVCTTRVGLNWKGLGTRVVFGPAFHSPYYFNDYGKGVKIITVKIKTCMC